MRTVAGTVAGTVVGIVLVLLIAVSQGLAAPRQASGPRGTQPAAGSPTGPRHPGARPTKLARPTQPARPAKAAKPAKPDKLSARITALEQEVRAQQAAQRSYLTVGILRKLYALEQARLPASDPRLDGTRVQLGAMLLSTGAYREAAELYREGIASAERRYGKDSVEVAEANHALAGVYWVQGRFADADALYQRALPIWKQRYGERSQLYALQLSGYASLLTSASAYGAALRAHEEALRIQESLAKSPDDVELLAPLQSLAWTCWNSGQQARGLELFTRMLKINETRPPEQAEARAGLIYSVAAIYYYGGRPELARPLFEQARAIYRDEIRRKEQAGIKGYQLSSLYTMSAMMAKNLGDLPAARTLLTRAIAIEEAASGGSAWYSTLADIERVAGNLEVALALIEKSERYVVKHGGPSVKAAYAPMRAEILRDLGRYDEAEVALRAYLRMHEQRLGPRHPIVGSAHLLLTHLFMTAKKIKAAEDSLARGLDVAERELALVLATGSEADHVVYFHRNAYVMDMAIALHARDAPTSTRAAELAMTTVLRRKGRILDASAGAMAALRGRLSPDDARALERLDETRAKLAKLIVAGPDATGPKDFGKAVAALDEEARELEELIRKRSEAYRAINQPIELASVQAAIAADARLVEVVNYQPYELRYNPGAPPLPRRYAAYVVARHGAPTFVDLGPVATIDAAVEEFRTSVADPDDDRVTARGRALYDLTLAKIAPRLGGATKIALAPDGQLNLVPFAALVEPGGGFVVQHLTITYLTSGRDLLRSKVSVKPHGKAVILADPAFGGAVAPAGAGAAGSGSASAPSASGSAKVPASAPSASAAPPGPQPADLSRGRRSRDLSVTSWRPLPGTRQEAEAIQQLLTGAKLLSGEQATEAALKAVDAPSILHVATHGFFLAAAGPSEGAGEGSSRGTGPSAPVASPAFTIGAPPSSSVDENPLLRSGLALAGANTLRSGADDGILTALEASGLNLWGTQLVVLSACETGVGKVRNGEGVYGLRRALVIAGAETLVMSLWQVDDLVTRDLMTRFYRKLESGVGRSEALRAAQLETLATEAHHHPYFWAAFQPTGDSSPIKEWR